VKRLMGILTRLTPASLIGEMLHFLSAATWRPWCNNRPASLDEFEAIRLADFEDLYHEEATARMNVSRHELGGIICPVPQKPPCMTQANCLIGVHRELPWGPGGWLVKHHNS